MTFKEIIQKRKDIWNKYKDPQKDRELVNVIVDTILNDENLRQELLNEPTLLIESTFTIVDKDSTAVPFFLNDVQQDFLNKFLEVEKDKYEKKEKGEESEYLQKPFIILKGRQQGFTSLISAIQLCYSITKANFSGMTIADTDDNTNAIFNDKAKYYYNMLPEALHPHEKFSNRKELFFDKLNSSWRIQVASDDMGRGRTLNFVHDSEVATFKCDINYMKAAIGQAMTKYSVLVYESTAHGYNHFKELWDSGVCINMFYEWWRTKEYYRKNTAIIDELLNDVDTKDWLKHRIKWLREEKKLSDEQIAWYCFKYKEYGAESKELLKQEFPCTPEEAFISSGECVFDAPMIQDRIEELRMVKPLKRGFFTYTRNYNGAGRYSLTNVQFKESTEGYITIMDEPKFDLDYDYLKRETGIKYLHPYTIGGDTAGLGSDYFTAKVINNLTRQTVATLRCRQMDDDVYAEQVACLGYYYNNALIGIEANFSYQPNRILEQLEYPFIYRRQREDVITHKVESKIGFVTSKKTKPIIINNLVKLLREDIWYETDIETLKEMLTFTRNGDKTEAQKGCHDDLVMALAIGHYVLDEQGTFEKIQSGEIDKSLFNEFVGEPEEEIGGYGEWFYPS